MNIYKPLLIFIKVNTSGP